MKKFKGFTLSEIIISLIVIATIVALSLSVKNVSINNVNLTLKKASQTLNEIVQNLLDDANYYDDESSFVDLNEVRLDDNTPVGGKRKFRTLFYNMLKQHVVFSGDMVLLCPVLVSEDDIDEDALCLMSEDGIIWGIPDTDFRELNVVKILNKGYENAYLPITVYPKCNLEYFDDEGIARCQGSSKDGIAYFEDNAVVFALRQDGDIKPYSKFDCSLEENSQRLQCRLGKIISDKAY